MKNVQNCANSTGNYVHSMDGLSRFAKNSSIQNHVNSTANCVHQMNGLFGFAENLNFVDKLNVQHYINSMGNLVH